MILTATLFAMIGGWIPPKRYDHPYKGRVEVVELSESFYEGHYGGDVLAFTYGPDPDGTCRIFINLAYRSLRRRIIRHEIGHCNGWSEDHEE
jgi:hypothetical protein